MSRSAWDPVFEHLRTNAVAPREVVSALNGAVTARDVTDWKRGAKRLPVHLLPQISVALGERPSFLAELLGAVPSADSATIGVADALRELDSLRQRIVRARAQVGSRSDESIARIAAAAVSSRKWAVAIWPAIAGPDGCRLHVSDRVDFRRTDGGECAGSAVVDDFGTLLADADAVVSTNSPRWADGLAEDVSSWSLVRYAQEFPPQPVWRSEPCSSISVVGLSESVQTRTIASSIARAVGYGHQASSLTSVLNHGHGLEAPSSQLLRSRTHEAWQTSPMPRYVNSHFGGPTHPGGVPESFSQRPVGAIASWLGEPLLGRFIVWIRESDDVLSRCGGGVAQWRELADEATHGREDVIVVEHAISSTGEGSRDRRVEVALDVAEEALHIALERDFLYWSSVALSLRDLADSPSSAWPVGVRLLSRLAGRAAARSTPPATIRRAST